MDNKIELSATMKEILASSAEHRYGMLARMQSDCKYFLGMGNRYEKYLWAGNVATHIANMKAIWDSFPAKAKPEWLSMEEIKRYENRMLHTRKSGITKENLNKHLLSGGCMDELLLFTNGQECQIFKADDFTVTDDILYIPDLVLNEIPTDRPVEKREIDDILSCCYTGKDFLSDCDGDAALARRLFDYCDWQHPSSALPELDDGDESDQSETVEDQIARFASRIGKTLLFSEVTMTANHFEATFYAGGIPREEGDLTDFSGYDDFMQDIEEGTEVEVHVEAFTFGAGETCAASHSELCDLERLIPDIFASHCDNIEDVDFCFTA